MQPGKVEFPASRLPAAQPDFIRGVAALHSFWCEQALVSFQAALCLDPAFAMAWWSVAMTHHRSFFPGSYGAAGRRALAEIREIPVLTARERAYLGARRVWYGDGAVAAREFVTAAHG